jgi:hypothetical protein
MDKRWDLHAMRKMFWGAIGAAAIFLPVAARAQSDIPTVVSKCGTVPAGIYNPGSQAAPTVDTNGNACGSASGSSPPASVGAYTASTTVSAGTTSGTLATAGQFTTALQLCTLPASTTNVWLNVKGAAAVVGQGVPVFFGGGCTNFGSTMLPMPTAAINAITDSGSSQALTEAGF